MTGAAMRSLASDILPSDPRDAVLVGRIFDPDVDGPVLVAVRGEVLVDITSPTHPTMSHLLDRPDVLDRIRHADGRTWPLDDVIRASSDNAVHQPRLLSPFDLQVLKAAGVTFARSMLERVIEEGANGDRGHAAQLRDELKAMLGDAVRVAPGSKESADLKSYLMKEGMWSQYLEVGLGPDPEIFTKAPVLSSVGYGSEVGVLARSSWNNPEPEVVLAVSSEGDIVGATLGNDVNLRDFEGRSALLLARAKDNNASCATGPFIRLFDESFTVDHLRVADVELRITGQDGFTLSAVSSVEEISRTFEELVTHTLGSHHQYPDGFALFTGTMFSPTEDRGEPGAGFTHHRGDVVEISTSRLGALVNVVTTSEKAPKWTYGISSLMANLHRRNLLER